MTGKAPRIYNVPTGAAFVDALAEGLLQRWGEDPSALSRAIVLLPTRRACRALREAFLRLGHGRSLLLPRMVPLGDVDEEELIIGGEELVSPVSLEAGASLDTGSEATALPPAMPPLKRLLALAKLIQHWGKLRGRTPSEDQAVRLADELGRLIDQVETEGLDFDHLAALVPEEYAAHWQITLEFLAIVTRHWPAIQAEAGCIGAGERRRLLLEAQAAAWQRQPPAGPVVVAGSTGTMPATAALIAVVAGLSQGLVVLPGLDVTAADNAWAAIAEDPVHPQHGLAVLLQNLGVARSAVESWQAEPGQTEPAIGSSLRNAVITAALRPAAVFSDPALTVPDKDCLDDALAGVQRIDCAGSGEEAAVIGLILRQALATPGRRAALVTPDRGLARRVTAELGRWGITVDDSGGTALADTPPGVFLRLLAEMAADHLAPLPLLAALKHPLAAGGLATGDFRSAVRALELAVLRGPRPASGFAGLKRALRVSSTDTDLHAWLDNLESMVQPLIGVPTGGKQSLSRILDGHIACAEALAATAGTTGAERLWAGESGDAAAAFIAELREAAKDAPPLKGRRYPALLSGLMAGRVVRPSYGGHPRLNIWGPLEARLQAVDVMVLGGLNEGTWPAEVDSGPWLSRPMRRDFGLPPPERRIGLAAHDFTQAFSAPEVYLTRATRVEGAPTVPSRWLLRLDALLQGLGHEGALTVQAPQWRTWAAALDQPAQPLPSTAPAPRPPLKARPRELSVTEVETWMRDPYSLYARKILALRPLDPIDADPTAAERGTLMHKALEVFVQRYPKRLPVDPEAVLLAIGEEVFRLLRAKPGAWAFWWPRFCRLATWFAEAESQKRENIQHCFSELRGELAINCDAGRFKVTAKADRIEVRRDGGLAIIDYKTGALPGQAEVGLGFAPQLPLEAAIAAGGGFPGVPAGDVQALAFWRLTGGIPAGQTKSISKDPETLSGQALAGLLALIARFDDPATPYLATPRPKWAPRFNDYAHLARIKEWSVDTDDDSTGGDGE